MVPGTSSEAGKCLLAIGPGEPEKGHGTGISRRQPAQTTDKGRALYRIVFQIQDVGPVSGLARGLLFECAEEAKTMFRMSFPATKGAKFGIVQVLLYCGGFLLGMALLIMTGFYSPNFRGSMYALGPVLIGVVFILGSLVGAVCSHPAYRGRFKKVGDWFKRNSGRLAALVMTGLAVLIGSLMVVGWDTGFMREYRYEIFWLVGLPAVMASPFLIGYLISRLSPRGA
jgi:hypothetical protein